jgi:type III secretion protein D
MAIKLPPEIVIIAGNQKGARAQLDSNHVVLMSGSSDTDMVLRDAKISNERLKITTVNDKAFIEVLDGNVEIEGRSIQQGKAIRLHEYTKVKIGDTAFIYTNEPQHSLEEILDKVSTEIRKTESRYHQRRRNLIRNNVLMSVSILLIVVIGVISTVMASLSRTEKVSVSTQESIQTLLIESGFQSLNIKQEDAAQFSINGFVMTYKEKALLEKLIDERDLPVMLDLEVGDQLAMEVRELFRINGIEVMADVMQEGEVKITADTHNAKEFESIKDIALKEIANLKSLNIELTESDGESQTIGSDMSYSETDKRITMVVGGNPAYILTADQSKYYVGALLPSGHKIVEIVDQQVVLEKQGKQKTLEF